MLSQGQATGQVSSSSLHMTEQGSGLQTHFIELRNKLGKPVEKLTGILNNRKPQLCIEIALRYITQGK